jgi:hypothetical protein
VVAVVGVAAVVVAAVVVIAVAVAAVAGNQRTVCTLNAETKTPQCANAAGFSVCTVRNRCGATVHYSMLPLCLV